MDGNGLFLRLAFERRQRLVVHVPLLEDLENGFRRKTRADQLAEDAGGLFLVFGFLQSLAAQEVARLFLVIDFVVHLGDSFLDDCAVDATGFQLCHYTPASEFFVVAAQAGVDGRIVRVVEVSLVFETADDELDERLSEFGFGFDFVAQQAFQFCDRAHAPAQSSDRVLVEFFFREDLFGAGERHAESTLAQATAFGTWQLALSSQPCRACSPDS
jgi:hypothetical protein